MYMYALTETRLCGNEIISEAVSSAVAHRDTYSESAFAVISELAKQRFRPGKAPDAPLDFITPLTRGY